MWKCPECDALNRGSVCKKCGYESLEWEISDGDEEISESVKKSEKRAIAGFVCVILAIAFAIVGVTVYRHARMREDYMHGHYVNDDMGIEITLPDGKWQVSEVEDYLLNITPKNESDDGSSIEIYKSEESAFDLACFEEEIEETEFKGRECYKALNGTDGAFSLNYYISLTKGAICVSIAGGKDKAITLADAQQLMDCIEIIWG